MRGSKRPSAATLHGHQNTLLKCTKMFLIRIFFQDWLSPLNKDWPELRKKRGWIKKAGVVCTGKSMQILKNQVHCHGFD